MKVLSAEFVGAAAEPGRFPPVTAPEVAFAGRSNVGKSSAINRLLGRRKLARTSSTPGRTQQLNFFRVVVRGLIGAPPAPRLPRTGGAAGDRGLVFVDLPGYGYARVSHTTRAAWRPLVESYLATRGALVGVTLLVDARRGLEIEERQLLDFLAACGTPVVIAATKIDKLARSARAGALEALDAVARTVAFSAVTAEGVPELWREIAGWTAASTGARVEATRTRAEAKRAGAALVGGSPPQRGRQSRNVRA